MKKALGLLLLTLGALAVHGYHPYVEDAEIYLPGVEKLLHPSLFPVGSQFFESHAGLSLFSKLIAGSVRITHIPFDYAIFIWQLVCIFLFLLACWQLAGCCLNTERARWGGVALVAALLTMPVAGTALYIIDQYLNARNVAAFASVFAVDRILRKRYFSAAFWLLFQIVIHPLMGAFTLSLCVLLVLMEQLAFLKQRKMEIQVAALLPVSFFSLRSSPGYHEAALLHRFHYILKWEWYEWLGAIAPILIFWWFGRIARARQLSKMALLCRALMIYAGVYFVAALIVSGPQRFEVLARIQPLRSLHLLYIVMLVLAGGLLAEYVLKGHLWRWAALFLPLCLGMFLAQRALFPASSHIEWPWTAPRNPWGQAFLWIKNNTPESAIFAMDPNYERIPGEGTIGFRCMAQRSRLADRGKDSGAVSMFPPLADEWFEQLQAQNGWGQLSVTDIERLRQRYGISWVVQQQPGIPGMSCPYENSVVRVCRLQP